MATLKNKPVCSPEIIRSNVGAFAEHIRRMAPAVNEIRVDVRHCSEALSQLERQHLGDLLTQLCQIGTRVKHMTRGPTVFDALQASCVRNLVHLDYYSETNCGLLAQLVRQNAATLQYLELVLYQRFDISELVCDDNGDYVQYPHLHTLKHAAWANLGGQTPLPEFEGAIPFPKLRHLFIRSSYPFGDDTPFRSNALTLERLEVELDDAAIAMLGKYKVFTPTSHPRLWYVSTKLVPGIVPGCFATMAAYLQLALSIAPSAAARRIEDRNFSDMTCPQVLSLFGNHASSINVLSLSKTRLDLWSIIALIKALPLLSDLHTTIPYLGEMPVGSSLATLPAHVISSYAPMGQKFRCWCFSREDEDVSEETAQCVLLLALICPNFDYAALLDGDRWQLMWMLEDTIDTDDFVEHEQRLERLLFSRWN
ncbi:hypothetical protein GGI00_003770 [Coemansia sp. RSA 2681]|nr:hypothetical protein GGI00_003770 [Coemansia sp. RSA 2681]